MIHADGGTVRDAFLPTDLPEDIDAPRLPEPMPGTFESTAVDSSPLRSADAEAESRSPTRLRWIAPALIMAGVLIGSAGGAGVAWKVAMTKGTPIAPLAPAAEAATPPTATAVSPSSSSSAAGQAEVPQKASPSDAPAGSPSPPVPASPVPPRRSDRAAAPIPGQAHAGSTSAAEAGSGVCAIATGAQAQAAIRRCIEWFSQAERQRTPAAN